MLDIIKCHILGVYTLVVVEIGLWAGSDKGRSNEWGSVKGLGLYAHTLQTVTGSSAKLYTTAQTTSGQYTIYS